MYNLLPYQHCSSCSKTTCLYFLADTLVSESGGALRNWLCTSIPRTSVRATKGIICVFCTVFYKDIVQYLNRYIYKYVYIYPSTLSLFFPSCLVLTCVVPCKR